MTEEDLVDTIYGSLRERGTGAGSERNPEKDPRRQGKWGPALREPYNAPYTSLPAKRIFLSEFEIKQMICGDRTLKLPRRAILSPLAQDWLTLKGIQIIEEED